MDHSFLIISLLSLAAFFLLIKYYTPKIKGYIGENKASKALKRLNSEKYTVLNNIELSTKGSSSQIDHIIVSNYGIFVIETKNYKGWILGYEKDKSWVQAIYKYRRKFYNPILQNQGHIYALKHLLKNYKYVRYYSIITFTKRATLKTKTYTDVVYINKLVKTIKQYDSYHINEQTKNEIVAIILTAKTNNRNKDKTLRVNSNMNKNLSCPNCGGNLMERNGKYGIFFGCHNFPRCTYTRNKN
ncbi:topoisomerase-like DNA binding C4 zinc finger protein [Chryseobacterium sp. 52]|uniref:NERD domain-containing protein n=1 Tax=Chryseobacterium sp. 52 TaxID=2035213 RepID=UPI000C1A4665|nr:NERD domain-containing protein [Chryseobacterium sp. 52]PIF45075.1 topoisomerase-like DNA binding C4 zinc finger protein [Chryseobacterium sp. 52]